MPHLRIMQATIYIAYIIASCSMAVESSITIDNITEHSSTTMHWSLIILVCHWSSRISINHVRWFFMVMSHVCLWWSFIDIDQAWSSLDIIGHHSSSFLRQQILHILDCLICCCLFFSDTRSLLWFGKASKLPTTRFLKRKSWNALPFYGRKMITRNSTISYQSYRMRKSGRHCKTQHSFTASLSDTSAHLTTRAIRTFLSNHLGDVLQRVKHAFKCLGYTEVMGSWYKRLMTGRRWWMVINPASLSISKPDASIFSGAGCCYLETLRILISSSTLLFYLYKLCSRSLGAHLAFTVLTVMVDLYAKGLANFRSSGSALKA